MSLRWLRGWGVVWAVALAIFASSTGWAQSNHEEEPQRRSNHFRSLTKIRNGSSLRRTTPPPAAVDLRGEYERRRDLEVVRHFQRLAELDAIAKIASDAQDDTLLSKVETVRRAELERFRLAMKRLREVTQVRLEVGLP